MLDELRRERLRKLEEIRKAKLDPYPARVKRTLAVGEARKKFAALEKGKKAVGLAGRAISIRDQGGVIFMDLRDESGSLQVVLKKDSVKNFDFLKGVLDRGDFVAVLGPLFKTKSGQESIEAKNLEIISKSIRPLPSEWYGIEETETRLRKRYLDLFLNPETRELFERKAIFWETARKYMKQNGFTEVELPVFESVPGGADAEPFKTHHNALDTDFYLRISLELPLKKLLVGGFEKVFEIGRIFRNEGIDREHLQDYTQLEFYWAYADYRELMVFVEKFYKEIIKATTGGLTTTWQGEKINWGKKWEVIKYTDAFKKANKLDPLAAKENELIKMAEALGLEPERGMGKGRLIDLIYKKTVRPHIIQPAFLIDPPVELVPLTKRSDENPAVGERMQPVAGGTELGTGFSELNDPIDQRKRFEEQMKLREAGDAEAQRLDEEFLEALEYGMPPAAGFGFSERLFAVLMDKPVRETVIFPLMRPRSNLE